MKAGNEGTGLRAFAGYSLRRRLTTVICTSYDSFMTNAVIRTDMIILLSIPME